MKRKFLVGLIVLGSLTVSGVLLATSTRSAHPCDDTVSSGCVSAYQKACYYFLQNRKMGESGGDIDRCFWDDHDFAGGGM